MRRFPLSEMPLSRENPRNFWHPSGAAQPSGAAKLTSESTRFKDDSRAVLIVKQGASDASAEWTGGYWCGLYRRFCQVRAFATHATALRFVFPEGTARRTAVSFAGHSHFITFKLL